MFATSKLHPLAAKKRIHRWIRYFFLSFAIFSTLWMVNNIRTRDVDDSLFQSSASIALTDTPASLELSPRLLKPKRGLIFFCGSGIAADAYVPLLRPVAEAGFSVFIIKLPWRFAPMESHKQTVLARAKDIIGSHPGLPSWIIAGHSLGAALSARYVQTDTEHIAGMLLMGSTHPKSADLSGLHIPVTKVFASNDQVAPREKIIANKKLLPAQTRWVEIVGGNHSQFAHYRYQLLDGDATIPREEQQAQARKEILAMLKDRD
ncbi:MAG: alpha/beta hydrolase [Pseudomonadota bacterium]